MLRPKQIEYIKVTNIQNFCSWHRFTQSISKMRAYCKNSCDREAQLMLILLELEFANLSAKQKSYTQRERVKSYERKDIRLYRAQQLLEECGWRYGLMMLKVRILVILYMYIYLIMYR